MWEHYLTKRDLELIELLKRKEMTCQEIASFGYKLTRSFLIKCEEYGVPIYESDENDSTKIYGILQLKQGG